MATQAWKPKDIIRHRTTGKPYLVLHVYIGIATIVTDAAVKGTPQAVVILPRDYEDYARDQDMRLTVKEPASGMMDTWEYEGTPKL